MPDRPEEKSLNLAEELRRFHRGTGQEQPEAGNASPMTPATKQPGQAEQPCGCGGQCEADDEKVEDRRRDAWRWY